MTRKYRDLEHRLIANSAVDESTPLVNGSHCWMWIGYRDHKGYGQITIRLLGRLVKRWAHRLAYEIFMGEAIPPDKEIDHLCANCACINPNHFEVVTKEENVARQYHRLFAA